MSEAIDNSETIIIMIIMIIIILIIIIIIINYSFICLFTYSRLA